MEIDSQLGACGWVVQDYKHAAVAAAPSVAVREVPTEAGPADYVLFVDRQAVGVIEAKKAGTTLTGVEPQTRKYQVSSPDWLPSFTVDGALPFGYESTGSETRFTCGLDPVPASRRVFSFHRPETLGRWVDSYSQRQQLGTYVDYPTLRYGIQHLPQLEPVGAHNSVVGADQGLRAPSWDQESVHDSVHEDSASAPIAAGQRPRQSFRHPQATPGTGMRRDPRPPGSDPRCSPSGPSRSPATDQVSSSSSSSATPSPPAGMSPSNQALNPPAPSTRESRSESSTGTTSMRSTGLVAPATTAGTGTGSVKPRYRSTPVPSRNSSRIL